MKQVQVAMLAAALGACEGGGSTTSLATPTAATPAPTGVAAATSGAPQVVIAFYDDAECTREVGRRRYDTGQSCFSWVANGSNAGENSANRFQCYRDRL